MYLPRLPVFAALVLILAGCARHHETIAIEPTPAPVVAYQPAPPPVSAINRDLSPAATVWHLRVALNVAALACRGGAEMQIIADYNALLRTQKGPLAAAQAAFTAEYKARGGDWQDAYDDSMTRLYNFFSQAQARDAFCAAAADVLARARALPDTELGGFAQTGLTTLDAPFARAFNPPASLPAPVIAAAATVQAAPAYQPATPAQAPRLGINVAALGE